MKQLMIKKSLKNTIFINIGAFLLVAILEILSAWLFKDQYDSDYNFYVRQLSFAAIIMVVIWINHFVFIPFFLDKRRYFLYGVLLVGSIFIAAYLKGYAIGWHKISSIFFFFIYTTGAGMAVFFLKRNMVIQRENNEKEKLQNQMELNYLKAQVNPHFLFNSLNSIYSLSRQQSLETPDVVMQLSELMRYQLESSKKDTVLLKEELEFLENYLLLEEKRLSKRCDVEFSIEGDLSGLRIAPMLLIPFVENAIKHGAQSTNEQSAIDVIISIKGTSFKFYVENTKPKLLNLSKREGFGLENVKRRLKLLYRDNYTIDIKDTEDLYSVNLMIDLLKKKN